MAEEINVSYESIKYEAMKPGLTTHYDLMAGTRRLREKYQSYLQKFPLENANSYELRGSLATLFNYYKTTVKAMVGLIKKRPVEFTGDSSFAKDFAEHWENIDQSGTPGDSFVDRMLEHQFAGHVAIVVAAPKQVADNAADEKAMGIRPYWQCYDARQLINDRYTLIDNGLQMTLAIFRTDTFEPVGDYGESPVVYFKEYRLVDGEDKDSGEPFTAVYWKEWRQTEDDETPVGGDSGLMQIDELPIKIAYGQFIAPGCSQPPLLDLADKNLEHFDDYADYRKGRSYAGLVVPVIKGGKFRDGSIGWETLVEVDEDYGDFYFAETSGAALAARRTALEDIKAEMADLGLSLLVDRSQTQITATQSQIDNTKKNSGLTAIAASNTEALNGAIKIHAKLMGEDNPDETAPIADLGYKADALVITSEVARLLKEMAVDGQLSLEDLLVILKLGGIMPDSFDIQEALERIAKEPKALADGLDNMNRAEGALPLSEKLKIIGIEDPDEVARIRTELQTTENL